MSAVCCQVTCSVKNTYFGGFLSISQNSVSTLVPFCSLNIMMTVVFHLEETDLENTAVHGSVLSLIPYLNNIKCQSGRNW